MLFTADDVRQAFQDNYQMAVEDGHTDDAQKIAWDWTEEEFARLFNRFKEQYKAEHQEAINRAFFIH